MARRAPASAGCAVSTGREQIFAALRQGYQGRNEIVAKVGIDARLARREANLVPSRGKPEGRTRNGTPVFNVSVPLLRGAFPGRPPFHLLEIALT